MEALRDALEFIESRLQSALDGNGVRPWSEDYLRDIIAECRDRARDALDDNDDEEMVELRADPPPSD